MRKRRFLFLLFFLLILTAQGQTLPTLRVLAVGNSFSEDAVEQYLYELAHEAGVNLIIGNGYRGGQSLASHWKDATTGTGTFQYRKIVDGTKTNRPATALRYMVTDEPWDIITFQQVSQESGLPDTYEPYLSQLIGYVKALARVDSVRFGFHQTWAYAKDSDHGGFNNYARNQFYMYSCITSAVEKTLRSHSELTFCIPSGTAIQNARTSSILASYPSRDFTRDGYHLDYTLGRYIAACTWLEAVTGISPVGLSFRPEGITEEQAAQAQEAAHKALLVPMCITPIK